MEMREDIVIVGAGIAGLATALGLHRLGFRSIVLESSDSLRITGFALTLWTNAWRALDALGIGDSLRQHSLQIRGLNVASTDSGDYTSSRSLESSQKYGNHESRCVRRKQLLEELENELPKGTVRYSSKVVSIEQSGNFKLLQLADGSTLKAKVLIGCDGVNSVIANWLGLQKPVCSGRSAIRGFVDFPDGHEFEAEGYVYFGSGVRCGFLPCDQKCVYWFCTFSPSVSPYEDEDPVTMKKLVLSRLSKAPKQMSLVVERTQLDCISCASLKLRLPWQLLLGNIVKDNVCLAGDAFHPMTPDIGQGGCSALEDSVVLARCLAEAISAAKPSTDLKDEDEEEEEKEEFGRIKMGLANYAKERRWRAFSLISTAYMVGFIQQSDNMLISFLRKRFLSGYTADCFQRMAGFDFGKLTPS